MAQDSTPKASQTELVSLSQIASRLSTEDLQLSCCTTVAVRICLYHPHTQAGPHAFFPSKGPYPLDTYFTTELCFPAEEGPTSSFQPPHTPSSDADEVHQLCGYLEYPSAPGETIPLDQIIRALQLDPEAKQWTVRSLEEDE